MTRNQTEKMSDLLKQGTDLLRRGNTAEALPLLEEAYALDPDNFDAALNLSGAYILSKQFKKAVPILERLSEKSPENEMVWTNLGAAYLGNPILAKDADQQRAVEAFQKALAINPAAPHAAYNIGLIYRDRQENDAAISWFQKALQANPNDQHARQIINRLRQKKEKGGNDVD